MVSPTQAETKDHKSQRGKWLCLAAFCVIVLLGANAHLLYVAVSSQPDCVEHSKTINKSDGKFRAAKSGC